MDGAFLICGHGDEHRDHDNDMIVVPDNCIIVVLMQYGESMPRVKLVEIHQKLYQLKEEGRSDILHDPLKHIPTLLEICGSVAIYQAGEECPNFDYQLFDCISATECYNAPVGVINLDTWSDPPYEFENTLRKSASPSQIIDYFSSPYEDSIYPTKKDIEDTVKEVIAQSNAQSNAQTSSLQAIYHAIEKKTDVTLSDILEFRKGEFYKRVYYHGLCRSKKDVTEALKHPFTDMITLHKNIEQLERSPLWGSHNRKREVSHTSNGKNRAITLKKVAIRALKHRIGETAKHRTPHIKTWMNSPVYQSRRREEVKKTLQSIAQRIRYVMQRIDFLQKKIERMTPLESSSEDYASTERNIKEAQAQLQSLHRQHDHMSKWEKSMDAPLPPPISYVQESNAERNAERNAESNALEYLNDIRGSANDREQLQRMREAHARFKKGRNEYMDEAKAKGNAKAQGNAQGNDYEKNMAYMTNEMKGYERGIKRLEYLTNVVPPFHTSRVKIDKNKQLQTMRNAHARFTRSREKYMEEKASASDTHQYKKNMNYFNRVLRDYEKGIHQAENPSYTRVNRNGTVKSIRK